MRCDRDGSGTALECVYAVVYVRYGADARSDRIPDAASLTGRERRLIIVAAYPVQGECERFCAGFGFAVFGGR